MKAVCSLGEFVFHTCVERTTLDPINLERPKSAIFIFFPFLLTSMFCGLRSRCTILFTCIQSTPHKICHKKSWGERRQDKVSTDEHNLRFLRFPNNNYSVPCVSDHPEICPLVGSHKNHSCNLLPFYCHFKSTFHKLLLVVEPVPDHVDTYLAVFVHDSV